MDIDILQDCKLIFGTMDGGNRRNMENNDLMKKWHDMCIANDTPHILKLKVKNSNVDEVRAFLLSIQTSIDEYWGIFSKTFIVRCNPKTFSQLIDYILNDTRITFAAKIEEHYKLLRPKVTSIDSFKVTINNSGKILIDPLSGNTAKISRSIWTTIFRSSGTNEEINRSLDDLGKDIVNILGSYDSRFKYRPVEKKEELNNIDFFVESGCVNSEVIKSELLAVAKEVNSNLEKGK